MSMKKMTKKEEFSLLEREYDYLYQTVAELQIIRKRIGRIQDSRQSEDLRLFLSHIDDSVFKLNTEKLKVKEDLMLVEKKLFRY